MFRPIPQNSSASDILEWGAFLLLLLDSCPLFWRRADLFSGFAFSLMLRLWIVERRRCRALHTHFVFILIHTAAEHIAEVESKENATDDPSDEALSPTSLRRSTRVSALKAQKKLKVKDGAMVDSAQSECEPNGNSTSHCDGIMDDAATTAPANTDAVLARKKKLKRKLSEADDLDQYDCKFGIRLDSNTGDVVLMTDESEISSLNEEELENLKKKYDQSKTEEISDEVRMQREEQIKQLEAELRLEEAKLSMLRKLRQNQQQAHLKTIQENAKRVPPSVQNATVNAYKPPIAGSNVTKNNLNGMANKQQKAPAKPANSAGTTDAMNAIASSLANSNLNAQQKLILQQLFAKAHQNPAQFRQLIESMTPQNLTAFIRQQNSTQQQAAPTPPAPQGPTPAEIAAKAKEIAQNNAHRISAARTQMRLALERQLTQFIQPKAPVPDLSFIPNGTQPDFCSLLGLDLCVQRVLKDRAVFKKVEFPPYQCEECGTDFTPSWKAICGEKGDYHLYCEQCVRKAQKRKVHHDQTTLLKRAFQKIQEQEKEFEKQVAAGKFSDPIPTIPPPTQATSHQNVAASTASPAASAINLTTTPSKSVSTHHNNTPSSQHHTSANTTPHQQYQQTSSANRSQSSNLNTSGSLHNTPRTQTATHKPAKRSQNSGSNSNAAATANAALSALSNSQGLQQLAAMNAFRQLSGQMGMNNPMLAAAMLSQNQNPMLMQQLMQQMMSQRLPQTTQANNNPAMAALLQVRYFGCANAMNLLAAMGQLGQLNASALMNNPQLMRQLQQVQFAQQMRDQLTKTTSASKK
ncbi:coiled-coil and interaction region of p66A and p66B with MBD2 domain-containing protein [Ditylenchus destructor]|uniref:Coiled-coil and interaction region of p66A and p66B with MBD2 domain-containing protein n=1 Tax=Ditylenchus destructor TaxID=166010 RepID=A0AAD4NEZ1_9BILA|nr:coiled-coil and interaction region of p66A and p66B with MBD2 domain-containing protein [Ditylenchus destructor]